MSDEKKRVPLRVVPDEPQPDQQPSAPAQEPLEIEDPGTSKEAAAFSEKVAELSDAPLSAGILVCVACYVADEAVNFHRQALSHARSGQFFGDTTPGGKSAEATRAWIDVHLGNIRRLADAQKNPECVPAISYGRMGDLKRAAQLAASELDRSIGVTKVAGLYFDDRKKATFEDAIGDLENLQKFFVSAMVRKSAPRTWRDTYFAGMGLLSARG